MIDFYYFLLDNRPDSEWTAGEIAGLKAYLVGGGGVYIPPALAEAIKRKKLDLVEGVHYHITRPIPVSTTGGLYDDGLARDQSGQPRSGHFPPQPRRSFGAHAWSARTPGGRSRG